MVIWVLAKIKKMTRKIIILTIGYFALGILTFTSCEGLLQYDATICDIQFAGLHSIGKLDDEEPDTFDNQIGFEIMSIESSSTCYIPTMQIFNSAYATTKCAEFQNQLLQSTYELLLDKSFVLNGDTIGPNIDLLSIQEVFGLTDIEINEDCKFATSTIKFRQELTDKMEFEIGKYQVTFKCSTSDNKNFSKTRNVIFKE